MPSFLLPQLVPKTLEELNWKADLEAGLKQQEEAYENEMKAVREHMKDAPVLGQEPATPEDTDAGDDLTEDESEDVDGMSEEGEAVGLDP